MNTDDLEKKLQRQTVRQIPAEWRTTILDAAHDATAFRQTLRTVPPGFFSSLQHRLSTFLWPHPKAWAGLAGVWMLVVATHFYDADSVLTRAQAPPTSPELVLVIKQQRLELARLIEQPPLDMEKPRTFAPSPRSELQAETREV